MLAIAALSARSLVQLARADGQPCIALDVFGDIDTCRDAAAWHGIADDKLALKVSGEKLLAALGDIARRDAAPGWIAGGGFEGDIDLLEAAARRLPLLGTAPADWRRLRDPRAFFECLADEDLAHPPVSFTPVDGWWRKDAGGCGGTHIVRSGRATSRSQYWQQPTAGTPMSATFVANGRDAVLLGVNEQTVQAVGDRPFVFAGVIGPLPVPLALRQRLARALNRLARHYRLLGLGSLDFLLGEGGEPLLLEVNPRPPASTALYAHLRPLQLHRHACQHGTLPVPPAVHDGDVRGTRIVFAAQPLQIGAEHAAALAAAPDTHDLPRAGSRIAAGAPVCTLSAHGADSASLRATLEHRAAQKLRHLETTT